MDGLDFDQAADIALDVPGWPEHRSLEETVRALAGGESFSADDALTAVLGAFAKEVGALFQMMLSVMLPVVLASLLIHMLTPQSDSLSTMSKSACFVLVLMPVIVMTLGELNHTKQTIVTMTRHMESLLADAAHAADGAGRQRVLRVSASDGCSGFGQHGVSGAGGDSAAGDVYMRGDGGQSSFRSHTSDADGAAFARRGLLAAGREFHGVPRRDVAARRDQREHRRRGDPRGQICGGQFLCRWSAACFPTQWIHWSDAH